MHKHNEPGKSNQVPVVLECYSKIKRIRVVHSPYGPFVQSRVLPQSGFWVPEPPVIDYQYRPSHLTPPSSVHGPPWYPPASFQYEYNTWDCQYFTYPIEENNKQEDRRALVQRKPVTITKPLETQENNRETSPPNDKKKDSHKNNRNYANKIHERAEQKREMKTYEYETTKQSRPMPRKGTRTLKIKKNCRTEKKNMDFSKNPSKEKDTTKIIPEKLIVSHEVLTDLIDEEELLKEAKTTEKDVLKNNDTTKDVILYSEAALRKYSQHSIVTDSLKIMDSKMSSSNITDDEKSSEKEKTDSTQSPFKSSSIIENSRTNLSSILKFTPSQLYKVRNTGGRNDEGNSSVTRSSISPEPKNVSSCLANVNTTPSSSISTVNSSVTSSSTHCAETESFTDGTPNSSLYFTPESTPTSPKHPDIPVIIRPRVKRSLNDQYKFEDPNSSNSSLNCTSYYTPENSPSDYGSSVKRLKTRWSGSASSFSFNDLDTLNESHERTIQESPDNGVIQPKLIGYQMIGDSQFCRFGQQLLGLERVSMPNSPGRIGICVSGQTITDLHRRVKDKFYPISDKIILMIGTNDFLRNVDVMTMCKELTALIETLQETVKNIVLLTLPPIPKLERKQKLYHFVQLDRYNSYIRSLENGEKLRIADVSPVYMSSPPYQKCRMQLFELYFGGPARKYDMIHLNRQGLEVIRKYSLLLIRIRTAVSILLFDDEDQLIKEVEKEVRDYAVKIGINPDTEKHFLNIARDGLMSPLPEEWKACLDKRIDRPYYYNVKTHQTQWTHPLDEHFENIVKKKRHEESISAGDDDSKTSIKEDLKSFEEAVTTSEMLSSRNPLDSHKSRITTKPQMNPSSTVKDPSPDGRKVLNPIGRPPLPPKRRAGSTSPKGPERGSLSLRLSPGPSPTRIDIDSIGVPLGLPSPELKSEKQPSSRAPAIKLTGGGSAFLKSKQKQSPSPTEDSRQSLEKPVFEIVREAESIDSPEDDHAMFTTDSEERRLKHSASLGESGFDMFTKSKRFSSLQESLLSLRNEMGLSNNEVKSTNTALRGILRDKPSPTTKLWDVDPQLLTSEEKEKLRIQEMRDERKQNVRFADIITKPINVQFSKSDSEDDSNTNDSSNDLDDFILEHMCSDDEVKKESKGLEIPHKMDLKVDLNENTKKDQPTRTDTLDDSLLNIKEPNRNILSRLTDLSPDSDRRSDQEEMKKRMIEMDNNNRDESEDWLIDEQNITNQNEQKMQKLRKQVLYNSKGGWDVENNSVERNLSEVAFAKSLSKTENLKARDRSLSPPVLDRFIKILDSVDPNLRLLDDSLDGTRTKQVDLKRIGEELNDNSSVKPKDQFRKSKLMPEVDLQKVFESVRESIINSTEQSDASEDVELMQTSPQDGDDIETALEQDKRDVQRTNTGAIQRTDDRVKEAHDRQKSKKLEEYKEQQRRLFEQRKSAIQLEFEENTQEMQREFQRQESLERQRFYVEVQQSVAYYKEEIDKEKNEREAQLRNQCEEFLKELETILTKDKELRVKKIKEDHEAFLKEQENKVHEEKTQFEEETKIRLKTSSSQLEKIVADLKQKEEKEIARMTEESNKKLEEARHRIELEQAEEEKKHKQELAIVEAEYEHILTEKRKEVDKLRLEQEAELSALRSHQEEAIRQLTEQHRQNCQQLHEQCYKEEESMRKRHSEKMDSLNTQFTKVAEKEDITQVNREFEKVRCEKRLLEDKYKSLKEKYVRLKNEVRLSMERKRQAKLNRQLQQRDPASTTEDTTERSTDHGKPPLARRKLATTLSSDDPTGENPNGTPKTIKRRPKPQISVTTTSSATAESSSVPPAKPKNVWNPSPQQRREGASSAEDNHTSVSEEIQMEQDDCGGEKWTQSALSPLENLRKQLEKLDDLEEKFPTSVHTDTYLRYPFSGPAGASCELEFYRHRLHLERESVRRAKQALAEQRLNIESRQVQLRHKQHTETLHQLHQEERELTDMEVSLHRTRALLGEKIIRLRYLEQSIERAAAFTPHHSQDTTINTNTDSSGFSGSDLDLSTAGQCVGPQVRSEMFWTENVLQSLENINSEIREIWTILGKQQVPGLGPPPVLNYESRAIGQGGVDSYSLAPHRATDIADRTRRLKEWLIRTRDQQTHLIAPVTL